MHSFKKQSIALFMVIALLTAPISAVAESDEPIDAVKETNEQSTVMDESEAQPAVMDEPERQLKDPQIESAYMVGDALLARPLGLVATVAGFGLFIVASPFALISGSAGDAWDNMVAYPARFTFTRPLGDFD
jgi:hypothetical protein